MLAAIFRDVEHEKFYDEMLRRSNCQDAYHRSLFYILGISRETRVHVGDLFDFSNDCIRPRGLSAAWQTSSTVRVSLLAFNLWNGWTESGRERDSSPS